MRFAETALLAATVVMATNDDYYPQTRTVWVGGDNKISPPELWANVGDKIEFHFLSGLHSVVEADFLNPCQDNGGFASGYFSTHTNIHQNVEAFVIKIENTDPIWYYDGAGRECMNGAVGVINPPNNAARTIEIFKQSASVERSSTCPRESRGGYATTY